MKSNKRRILHVIAALEGGGAERQLHILANNTDLDRYDVSIIFLHKGTGQYVFNDGIEMLQIPRGRKWNIPSLWFRIYKAVKAYQPDILQLWMPEIITIPAALAGKLSGAYIISSVRMSMRSVHSIKTRLRDRTSYIQHIMANRIVTNFNPDAEPYFFRRLFLKKKGIVIFNAITISQDKTRSEAGLPVKKVNSFLIWFTGRIAPQKRLDILLDSFVELRKDGLDISLVICGQGDSDLTNRLKQKIQQADMQEYVRFLGYRRDWHDLVEHADLFVLPSTSEGMPNVLFEAMLMGLACIATDIPVINSMVKHKENVWLVKAASQSSLSEGIRQMYQSASLREEIAQKGQRYAESFSIEKMSQAYETLYEQAY
jgi:GalNAc-alpha-(1->4)-GalNAc-alpha-(1->3)-diNAcBac-PP-undecaprenol alpha-1,4-N-acetyl-D-galactosaminyltransferase